MLGRTIGRYQILEALGDGGCARVYEAIDTRLGRRVALKFLKPSLVGDPRWLERLTREAMVTAALNHPNICTIYDIDEDGGRPFIVMEYLEGCSLQRWIARREIGAEDIARTGIGVAEGLGAAHARGVIHRDIKPANIFLIGDGSPKILDFGVATLMGKGPIAAASSASPLSDLAWTVAAGLFAGSAPGAPVSIDVASRTTQSSISGAAGTLGYMSPEQVRGKWLDPRTDLFSLGIVLYEMATGRQPFAAASTGAVCERMFHAEPPCPSLLNPSLSRGLAEIIERSLRKDPSSRYQSAWELAHALRRVQQDQKHQKDEESAWSRIRAVAIRPLSRRTQRAAV